MGDLTPSFPLQYLFVGTFNPSWDNPNGNNANWYYGRRTNDFWYIMPQVFGHQSLMPRQFRTNPDFLRKWCEKNSIGVTDLISSIQDANENNPEHKDWILGMQDEHLENFDDIACTRINNIIEENHDTLQGIYLTRYTHTLDQQGILFRLWNNVVNVCNQYQIPHASLVTPSRGYRVMNRNQKLHSWQQIINT